MKNIKSKFYIQGIHCASCILTIREKLSQNSNLKVEFDGNELIVTSNHIITSDEINKLLLNTGYKVQNTNTKNSFDFIMLLKSLVTAVFIIIMFSILSKFIPANYGDGLDVNLIYIFLVGVSASLSTCMSFVGSLVLSISSNYSRNNKTLPIILFHVSRVVTFYILGGILGSLGSILTINSTINITLNLFIYSAILLSGINLIYPLTWIRKFQSKLNNLNKIKGIIKHIPNSILPVLLGFMTFFLPCGFTQSVQMYSISLGSFSKSSLTMLSFALGTLPVLSIISVLSIKLKNKSFSNIIYQTSGILIIFFSLYNLYILLT